MSIDLSRFADVADDFDDGSEEFEVDDGDDDEEEEYEDDSGSESEDEEDEDEEDAESARELKRQQTATENVEADQDAVRRLQSIQDTVFTESTDAGGLNKTVLQAQKELTDEGLWSSAEASAPHEAFQVRDPQTDKKKSQKKFADVTRPRFQAFVQKRKSLRKLAKQVKHDHKKAQRIVGAQRLLGTQMLSFIESARLEHLLAGSVEENNWHALRGVVQASLLMMRSSQTADGWLKSRFNMDLRSNEVRKVQMAAPLNDALLQPSQRAAFALLQTLVEEASREKTASLCQAYALEHPADPISPEVNKIVDAVFRSVRKLGSNHTVKVPLRVPVPLVRLMFLAARQLLPIRGNTASGDKVTLRRARRLLFSQMLYGSHNDIQAASNVLTESEYRQLQKKERARLDSTIWEAHAARVEASRKETPFIAEETWTVMLNQIISELSNAIKTVHPGLEYLREYFEDLFVRAGWTSTKAGSEQELSKTSRRNIDNAADRVSEFLESHADHLIDQGRTVLTRTRSQRQVKSGVRKWMSAASSEDDDTSADSDERTQELEYEVDEVVPVVLSRLVLEQPDMVNWTVEKLFSQVVDRAEKVVKRRLKATPQQIAEAIRLERDALLADTAAHFIAPESESGQDLQSVEEEEEEDDEAEWSDDDDDDDDEEEEWSDSD
jgi:hypothetical protein